MAGFWQKTKEYLGLADDDTYEYEPYEEAPPPRRPAPAPPMRDSEGPGPARPNPGATFDGGVGSIQPQPRVAPAGGGGSGSVRTVTARPVPPPPKVHVVAPISFAEAQEIGVRFRSAQPVIINLTAVDRDLARRLVDFASGLAYGLSGTMKKVADKVFMLTPANVEVSADERRRLAEKGLLGS